MLIEFFLSKKFDSIKSVFSSRKYFTCQVTHYCVISILFAKSELYPGDPQTSIKENFPTIVKAVNYFYKALSLCLFVSLCLSLSLLDICGSNVTKKFLKNYCFYCN